MENKIKTKTTIWILGNSKSKWPPDRYNSVEQKDRQLNKRIIFINRKRDWKWLR